MPLDAASIRSTYAEQGFVFPIRAMSAEAAGSARAELEALEKRLGGARAGNKSQLNYPHVLFRFAAGIARSAAVLDPVEALIGPDILLWGSTFFIKEPRSTAYVSWHQDLRYWGLADDEGMVSAWLALSDVTGANGCMRFVPGSHKGALVAHNDTFVEDNILTRGQEASVEIDEAATVNCVLQPGEMSLHHGRLLHASAPNRTDDRRIGFVMNFVAASNRQKIAPVDYAMLCRGKDDYGHFRPVPAPAADLSAEALEWHARILRAQNDAMYDGAAHGPG